jgi:glycosyltransferase involved in cell wall biosynthesis
MIFSIIIPVYKTEKYLNECVQSILSQSFNDYECILIDDGSPDNCPSMCDGYSRNDVRIKVIHKGNSGPSDSRNMAILQAKGEYIVFLDSDDKFTDNDTLKNLFDVIQKNKTDVIINVNIIEFTDNGSPSSIYKFCKDVVLASPNELIDEFNKTGMYFALCFFVLKKDYLIQNNLFFKNGILHEDEHWFPRVLCKTQKIAVNHSPFYSYRVQRHGSTMSKITFKRIFDLLDIINDLLIWAKEEDNYTKEGCAFMQEKAKDLYNDVFRLSDSIKHQDKKAYHNIHKKLKNICVKIPDNYKGKRFLFSKIIGPYNTDLLYKVYIQKKQK